MLRRHRLSCAALVFITWATIRLSAQDVTVTPLTLVNGESAVDEMPKDRNSLQVTFPAELRKTSNIGYVVLESLIDAEGKANGLRLEATLPAYQKTVMGAWWFPQPRRFTPAKRAGQPVSAQVRTVVVFNPSSAAPDTPDATPRLLNATTVVDPKLSQPSGLGPHPSPVVWANVVISETGQPVGINDVSPSVLPLIEKALESWAFAPARRGGQPIQALVAVPFVLVAPQKERMAANRKVVYRQPPIYPIAMRNHRITGEVLLEFVVDAKGRVKNAQVIRHLNPYFDEAALEAIRQWRYEPAANDGSPTETRLQQPIGFWIDGETDDGQSGRVPRKKADLSALPEEMRYDTPPKLTAPLSPVYPYELLLQGIGGSAQVRYVVDANGRVAASTVSEADRPELGLALQAAVELFLFEPAVKDGRAIRSVSSYSLKFSASDYKLLIREHERAAFRLEKDNPEKIIKASKLDGKLVPTKRQEPAYPATLKEKNVSGEAKIQFLIDEQGRVCLPRIVSATEPAFGYAAAQAAVMWRFEPPMSGGKPAVTKVMVPFLFKPPARTEPADAGTVP